MYYYCWVSDQLQRLDAGTFIQLYFKLFQCEPTLMALVLLHVTSTEKVSLLFFFYHLTLFHKSKVTKTLKKMCLQLVSGKKVRKVNYFSLV